MEKTEATGVLAQRAKAVAAALGFELNDASTGGASDANPIAAMGIPVLDGLGPIGGDDHSPTEWLALSSVPPRVALLARAHLLGLSPPARRGAAVVLATLPYSCTRERTDMG